MKRKSNKEIRIKGIQELFKVEQFVEEICDYYNINQEYFGNILLATTEATGILLSLNDCKGKGKVLISFERSSKGLIFKIKLSSDVGETVKEDLLEQEIKRYKLSKEIFIVKALADEITISLTGKSVTMVFYISSINYEKSLKRITTLKEYWQSKAVVSQKKNE